MSAFWDGLKLVTVIFMGTVVLILGIVVYAVVDTFNILVGIVTGKRKPTVRSMPR